MPLLQLPLSNNSLGGYGKEKGGYMPQAVTWVLVSDSSHAKIFRSVQFPKIEVVETLEHPESRFRAQDLVSGEPGRNFQKGGPTRHAYQSVTDPKRVEAEKFATYLNQYLTAAHQKGAFSRLYILANPSFLGLLRQHLDTHVQKTIIAESPQDITAFTTAEIESHLSKL